MLTVEHIIDKRASLQAVATDSTNSEGVENDWKDDDFSKVMLPEKRGYVRCIGKMPYVKDNINASSSLGLETVEQQLAHTQGELAHTKGLVNVLVNLFKEHIPNANLPDLTSLNMEVVLSTYLLLFVNTL